MGGWAVAQSPILVTTITLDRLRQRGYESMLSLYEKIAPHLNEPLYTLLNKKMSSGHFLMKGRTKFPYVQWCERRSPSVFAGGAVYSISGRCYFPNFCFI